MRSCALLIVLAACGDNAAAPAPALPDAPPAVDCAARWTSDLQLGTAADDEVLGLALDDRDDLVIAGFEHGVNGVTNIEPAGDAAGVIASYAPDGARRWRTTIDTPGTDTVEDVAIDPVTGAIVLVGRTSDALPGAHNAGQLDLVIGELDAAGRPTALAQLGDERPQHPAQLDLGPGGMIGVAGWDDTYVPTNYVEAWQDGFVARFDRRGGAAPTRAWLRFADPAHWNVITDVAVDAAGTTYATGSDRAGMYVEARGPDGEIAWRRTLSSLTLDAANAIALAPGALYVTGATFRQLGAASFGQQDAFVAKLDPATGAIAWIAQAGGPASDYPTAIALGPDGGVTIAGVTLGGVGGASNQGEGDVFAMRFDASGALVATWQRGTPAEDDATSVVVDRCGVALVGGWTGGALVGGATPAGGADMFVLALR